MLPSLHMRECMCVVCVVCSYVKSSKHADDLMKLCWFLFFIHFFLLAILLYGIAKCSLVVELDVFGRMAKPSKAPSRILLRHFSWTLIYNLAFAGWRCWLFRVLFLLLLYITQESCRTLNISCPNAAVFWPSTRERAHHIPFNAIVRREAGNDNYIRWIIFVVVVVNC